LGSYSHHLGIPQAAEAGRISRPSQPKCKTYIRDDGVVMVEICPHVYVEESMAERLGLLR